MALSRTECLQHVLLREREPRSIVRFSSEAYRPFDGFSRLNGRPNPHKGFCEKAMVDNNAEPSGKLETSLVNLALEAWRLARLFSKVIAKLDAGEGSRYANQVSYFQARLDENLGAAGLRLVNIEGQVFDAGMAAAPLNISDFSAEDELLVDQMIEPIIMGPHGIKREGTVILKRIRA